MHENCEMAALLLAHGADPNAVSTRGDTILCLASRIGDDRMVNLLIAHMMVPLSMHTMRMATPRYSRRFARKIMMLFQCCLPTVPMPVHIIT
jgi:hypothetical protein